MKKYFDFLTELRNSGFKNMAAASPKLKEAFPELSDDGAIHVLILWCQGKARQEQRRSVDAKGRIEIPKEIRDSLNIGKGDELIFVLEGDRVYLDPLA